MAGVWCRKECTCTTGTVKNWFYEFLWFWTDLDNHLQLCEHGGDIQGEHGGQLHELGDPAHWGVPVRIHQSVELLHQVGDQPHRHVQQPLQTGLIYSVCCAVIFIYSLNGKIDEC